MQTFDTIRDAREAITDFYAEHRADVPADMLAKFKELSNSPSPVDQIVGVGEFVWGNRDKLTDAAKALGAGLIAFATTNAWHGLLEDDRGNAIVANLRKDLGEIKTAPAAPDAKPGSVVEQPEPTPQPDNSAPAA